MAMGRYADIKSNFISLKKATDIFHASYGNGLFIFDVLTNHQTRFYIDYIQKCVRKEVDSKVRAYLDEPLKLKQYYEEKKRVKFGSKIPIWVCWFQGFEKMPELVKVCYKNLYKMVDSDIGEIILITENNFSDYVQIEPSIIKKVKDGRLSYTNLSDLLRVNLLAIYGGMWIDATVYVTRPIDSRLLEKTFYSQKSTNDFYVKRYVTKSRWASWMMISSAKEELFKFVAFIMNEYYLKHNSLIDYYLIDYVIEIAYNELKSVQTAIDSVEVNNTRAFEMFNSFNEVYNSEKFEDIIRTTQFLKFTYKSELVETTESGKMTNYGFFKKKYIEGAYGDGTISLHNSN